MTRPLFFQDSKMQKINKNLWLRAEIIQAIRSFFVSKGFLEVETPLRIPSNAPEEYIEPTVSGSWFLQTSPEICMKRLLCRGHDKIFQISRCWRNDERGKRHLPEFTMLEWYRSNSDYTDLMDDCEELLRWIVQTCKMGSEINFQGNWIDVYKPALKITVKDCFEQFANKTANNAINEGIFEELLVDCIEPSLPKELPVILKDYPAEMAALARLKGDDRSVAERFELYLGGIEIANGFSELIDPEEQRMRFNSANEKRASNAISTLPLPEPFLEGLASMPPSSGIALGIDRLVMIFADSATIDDVVAFTPEEL